jgi:hypothetical protein
MLEKLCIGKLSDDTFPFYIPKNISQFSSSQIQVETMKTKQPGKVGWVEPCCITLP